MTTPEKAYCDRQLCVNQEYAIDGGGGCHKCPAGEGKEMTTPEMSEKEKLINELSCLKFGHIHHLSKDAVKAVAEFVISDRARIVEPIIEFRRDFPNGITMVDAIDESLRRAGRKD